MQSATSQHGDRTLNRMASYKSATNTSQAAARHSTTHLFKQSTVSQPSETSSDLLFLEDYHAELDDEFLKEELRPYLMGVFADFALRSTAPTNGCLPGKSIDKVTFTEYTNLPGIISDRFFALAKRDRTDNRIGEDDFLQTMFTVFSSSLDNKMKFVFQM